MEKQDKGYIYFNHLATVQVVRMCEQQSSYLGLPSPTIILNCWISVDLLKKRPRVQLSADSTPRALTELKRECYLRSDVRKRSDFVVFWHKDATMYTPSDLIHWKIRQVVKQPTHCSQTVGDVVTGVVVSLQFTLGGIHNSLIYQ